MPRMALCMLVGEGVGSGRHSCGECVSRVFQGNGPSAFNLEDSLFNDEFKIHISSGALRTERLWMKRTTLVKSGSNGDTDSIMRRTEDSAATDSYSSAFSNSKILLNPKTQVNPGQPNGNG